MHNVDVLICGAGVGGLTLAHALGLQGRRVLLVDKQREPAEPYKGEVLQPRSLQIFDDLGLLKTLRDRDAALVERLVCAKPDGAQICTLDYRQLPEPFDHCLVHYYKGITGTLAERLPDTVEFRRGVRADGLVYDSARRVTGARLAEGADRFTVTAGLTVACDGYSSRLRADAGLGVAMTNYEHQVLAFDLPVRPRAATDAVTHVTRDGIRLVYPMPGGRTRFYAQLAKGGFAGIGRAGLPEWIEWLIRTVPALTDLADPLRASVGDARALSARRFIADVWQRPGFVLLGDAAHCVHPMAGQGMNAAIADAYELGRQLERVGDLDARATDEAVGRYVQASRARMEFVARFSHNFAALFTGTTTRERVMALHILRRHGYNLRLSAMVMYNLSGLGVLRFSTIDRLHQLGLPDPRARRLPAAVTAPQLG